MCVCESTLHPQTVVGVDVDDDGHDGYGVSFFVDVYVSDSVVPRLRTHTQRERERERESMGAGEYLLIALALLVKR